ncbi:cellulose biosynthesis protein BcsG, partial [Klebsiella pneumoniae]|uniref:cellulose biosynthesis protein BcsG n=2 Tax=Pseudomonadota TaxID=1224 RepID=UPI00254BD86C
AHEGCQLFGQLQQAGYAVEMGMNHNGTFDNFRQLVKGNLGATVPDPLSHTAVPAGVQAFDGSAVGRDGDYLRTWWSRRLSSNKPAVALYYNTITLHDGNVLPGSRQDSLSTYPLRVE